MLLRITSNSLPISISVSGSISQIQYVWRLEPVLQYINTFDLHRFFVSFKRFLSWSKVNNVVCKYDAPLLYRMAIWLLP